MVEELKLLLKKLPTLNYKVLDFVMEFARQVSEHSDKNKMKPSNIAICLSPNLLRPKVETIDFTLNITKINAVVEIMVDRYGEIFRNEPPRPVAIPEPVSKVPSPPPPPPIQPQSVRQRKIKNLKQLF